MKRLSTVILVVVLALTLVTSSLATIGAAGTPTTSAPPATATGTGASATPARGAPPTVAATANTTASPSRGLPPTVAPVTTPTTTATATQTPTVPPAKAAETACAPTQTPTGPSFLGKAHTEVPAQRTRTSTTYRTKEGYLASVLSPGSVNYQDAKGAWQPIGNGLVASTATGYALRNTANRYTLSLPGDLGGAPVRMELGGASLSFSLVGAKGTGTACAATETYLSALAGVDVAYTAGNDAVKETLTLASAAAPHTFVFNLQLSAGLTARTNATGGVEIVDGKGATQFAIPAPFMDDHSGKPAGHSTAVTLQVAQVAGGATVTMTADAAWLADPARVYPVVIDPSVTVGTLLNCTITNGTTTSSCTTTMNIGYDGTNASRALVAFNNTSLLGIPSQAQVVGAEFGLYMTAKTTNATTPVEVRQLTAQWDSNATWTNRDATHNWTLGGGDFTGTVAATRTIGSATGWQQWYPNLLTQSYVNGTATPYGVLLKESTENVTNVMQFATVLNANSALWPYLVVYYSPWLGTQRIHDYTRMGLNDRMDLAVNDANGNLVLHERDITFTGTGISLTFDRTFNSAPSYAINTEDYGTNWHGSTSAIRLFGTSDGSIVFRDASGFYVPYYINAAGTAYLTPTGMDSTLKFANISADKIYTLNFHRSNVTLYFDALGIEKSVVDKNGNGITYHYNASNNVDVVTDMQGRTLTYTYTTQNGYKLATQIDEDSRITGHRTYLYTYDATTNNLTSYTDPLNGSSHKTLFEYDGNGDLTKVTDPATNITKITYDGTGRVATIIRVTNNSLLTGPTTTFTYNSGNTVVGDANSNNTTFTYDPQGRVTSVLDALSHTQAATYNDDSNVLSYTDALSKATTLQWRANAYTSGIDNGESVTQVAAPASGTGMTPAARNLGYNSCGTAPSDCYLPKTDQDAQGNTNTNAFDSFGNRLSTTNPLGSSNIVSATYNTSGGLTNGTLATTTDAMTNVTSYGYTYAGSAPLVLTQIVVTPATATPTLGATTLHYDGLGRLSSKADGKSQTTTYTYDALNRITRVTYNGDTGCSASPSHVTCTDYGYDANGNLTSVVDKTGTTTYTFDKQNRQLTKSSPAAGSPTYTYDGVGNLLTVTDASLTVTYHYNAVNLLDSLAEPGGSCTGTVSKCTTFTYDANNRRATTTYPNGVVLTEVHNNAGQLLSIIGTNGGTTLTSFVYTYVNGTADTALRGTMTTGGVTTNYCYDEINRLRGATATSTCLNTTNGYQYTYNGNGNRLTVALNGTPLVGTPTYNAVDELTALGATTLGYDGNGNETGRSTGLTAFSYNAKDQTLSITASGTALGMTYTGDSQVGRITAGGDSFAYGVLGLAAKTNGGSTTYYTRDNGGRLVGERIGTSAYYYLFDGLGSVVAVTGSAGTALDTYTYDPYGNVTPGGTNSVANPWQFASGYLDSVTGLMKFGQRYYDPSLGRWTQRDPLGVGNPYAYAGDMIPFRK